MRNKGISVKLLDMHTIKPLDREAVVDCLNIGKIITVGRSQYSKWPLQCRM